MKRKLANCKSFLMDPLWNPAQSAGAARSPSHSVSSACHQTRLQGCLSQPPPKNSVATSSLTMSGGHASLPWGGCGRKVYGWLSGPVASGAIGVRRCGSALPWWAGWGWTQGRPAPAAVQPPSPLGWRNLAVGSVLSDTDCVFTPESSSSRLWGRAVWALTLSHSPPCRR